MASSSKTEIILMIAENFGVQATERIIYLWLSLLEDYPEAVCQKAALSLIRNAGNNQVAFNSMPPFALMQKELDALTGQFSDPKEQCLANASNAWNKLMKAVEVFGSYRVPKGFDRTLLYCIRSLGGWSVICNWKESDLNWRKKEFLELYQLADGKVDLLEAGTQAIDAFYEGNIALSSADTKNAVSDYMESLKERQKALEK